MLRFRCVRFGRVAIAGQTMERRRVRGYRESNARGAATVKEDEHGGEHRHRNGTRGTGGGPHLRGERLPTRCRPGPDRLDPHGGRRRRRSHRCARGRIAWANGDRGEDRQAVTSRHGRTGSGSAWQHEPDLLPCSAAPASPEHGRDGRSQWRRRQSDTARLRFFLCSAADTDLTRRVATAVGG